MRIAARFAFPTLLMLVVCGPLAAYTVWLKDGSSISARGKYQVQGVNAIIVLPNGTQTYIKAALIDVAKSDSANKGTDYGATDLGDTHVMPGEAPPPPVNKSLTDIAGARAPSTRVLPNAKRRRDEATGQVVKSKAGYLDLDSLPRTPYARQEIAEDLRQFLHAQGLDEVELFAGSQVDRVFVLLVTSSEGVVFRSVSASANALLHLREKFPGKVGSLELLMKTPTHEKAGQFVLTPDVATDLVAKKIDVPAYFVANVQF
jgi:hypothetical protein